MKKFSQRSRIRNMLGVSVVMLGVVIAFVILPMVGIWAFEAGRANLAHQQLTNAVDAASLACAATLASQDDTNPSVAHANAMQAGLKIFKRNGILSNALDNATLATQSGNTPPLGESRIFFEFLNPETQQVEPLTSARGKIVRGYGDAALPTAFGQYLGLGPMILHSQGRAAVPELDVVVCFDISGSIDDQTNVSLVRRQNGPLGLIHTVVKNGMIRDITSAPATGTSANAVPPLGLSQYNSTGFYFSENGVSEGLRSGGVYPEDGRPAGNPPAPLSAPSPVGTKIFTDMVVNLDANASFGGFTDADGYAFPTVATLVEASRGNLENPAVFNASKANTAVSVAPRTGYKDAYAKAAKAKAQPIQDARDATRLFLQILNNNTHAHFGFVAFDHMVGTNSSTTETKRDIDDAAPYGANVPYPVAQVELDRTPAITHFDEAMQAVDRTQAKGSTNIGAAVLRAVELLAAQSRPDAVKAIVLFTDGQPTAGGPLSGDPWANARAAAVRARDAGIPVYTIGLAQTPAVVPGQTAILNDTNNNPSTGGIAAISGQGATFNAVTDSRQLRSTFEKIARHLVQLVQGIEAP